jgi:hypothetical protein
MTHVLQVLFLSVFKTRPTDFELQLGCCISDAFSTTDHGQATDKLYHLRMRVECTLFVISKAGREPTPYW